MTTTPGAGSGSFVGSIYGGVLSILFDDNLAGRRLGELRRINLEGMQASRGHRGW